jgi:carboxylesterase type B
VHSPWGPSVLDATKFPEECAQLSLVPTVRFEGSENCLFLNVYRPTDAVEGTDLPVLFYIHGGGDIIGAADKTFPGDYLAAEHGMVVVVVQYRWVATAVATEAPLVLWTCPTRSSH